MTGKGIGNRSSRSVREENSEFGRVAPQGDPAKRSPTRPSLAVFAGRSQAQITSRLTIGNFADSLAVFAAPKRIGLKSHIRLWGVLLKAFDYAIRRLNALSAGPKNRLRGLTFAEAPLSAISRFNWSPESTEARRLFEAPREDDSWFRADLGAVNPK